ncbi:hypothetical protein NP493_97g05028 [Ridgeia piscesae]|uniref:Uncharacterized protein n=1 Tax=Ridgeia piscesae TaxID=27915 RepID=A0AAD9UHJ6_RIDPI|nr:hypothetical protein NP493_97g05028 [Ridgeia piscesae]
MRVAFVNCTVLADYYTCSVQTLPPPTTAGFDPDVLTRLHSVIVSVVCLIGVLMVAGFVLCLVCTRGTRERSMESSEARDEEKSPALPGLYTISAATAVLHPMLFPALAAGAVMTEPDAAAAAAGKDSPAYLADQLPPRPAEEEEVDEDEDEEEFFGSRTSFHSDCSLPATPVTPTSPSNTDIMLYGYQASRI